VILLCVRWYLRYSLSYRELEELIAEQGLSVDHSCRSSKLNSQVFACEDREVGNLVDRPTVTSMRVTLGLRRSDSERMRHTALT
jgi:hypothetical protein